MTTAICRSTRVWLQLAVALAMLQLTIAGAVRVAQWHVDTTKCEYCTNRNTCEHVGTAGMKLVTLRTDTATFGSCANPLSGGARGGLASASGPASSLTWTLSMRATTKHYYHAHALFTATINGALFQIKVFMMDKFGWRPGQLCGAGVKSFLAVGVTGNNCVLSTGPVVSGAWTTVNVTLSNGGDLLVCRDGLCLPTASVADLLPASADGTSVVELFHTMIVGDRKWGLGWWTGHVLEVASLKVTWECDPDSDAGCTPATGGGNGSGNDCPASVAQAYADVGSCRIAGTNAAVVKNGAAAWRVTLEGRSCTKNTVAKLVYTEAGTTISAGGKGCEITGMPRDFTANDLFACGATPDPSTGYIVANVEVTSPCLPPNASPRFVGATFVYGPSATTDYNRASTDDKKKRVAEIPLSMQVCTTIDGACVSTFKPWQQVFLRLRAASTGGEVIARKPDFQCSVQSSTSTDSAVPLMNAERASDADGHGEWGKGITVPFCPGRDQLCFIRCTITSLFFHTPARRLPDHAQDQGTRHISATGIAESNTFHLEKLRAPNGIGGSEGGSFAVSPCSNVAVTLNIVVVAVTALTTLVLVAVVAGAVALCYHRRGNGNKASTAMHEL